MRGSGGPARHSPHPAADFVQLALKLELVGGEAVANGGTASTNRVIRPTHRGLLRERRGRCAAVRGTSIRWARACRSVTGSNRATVTTSSGFGAWGNRFLLVLSPFLPDPADVSLGHRSEERRVGKECRSRWSP